jgi:methionine synthase II (cobalamin-independent)
MKEVLFNSYEALKKDGVICIQIDEHGFSTFMELLRIFYDEKYLVHI